MKIFDQEKQDTHAGGSGCGCAAVTLSALYSSEDSERESGNGYSLYRQGTWMSTVSYNEGASVPELHMGSCWNIAEKREES